MRALPVELGVHLPLMLFGEEPLSLGAVGGDGERRGSPASPRLRRTTISCSRRRGSTADGAGEHGRALGRRGRSRRRCRCRPARPGARSRRRRGARRALRGTARRRRSGRARPSVTTAPRDPLRGALEAIRRGARVLRALLEGGPPGGRARRARPRAAPAPRRQSAVDRSWGSPPAWRAWRGRATAGSRPPRTRRRSGSRPQARASSGRTRFPNALATMWTWVTEDRAEGSGARRRPGPAAAPRPRRAARAGLRRAAGTAPSCSRATPRPAASASTSGRSATRPRQLELVAETIPRS